MKTEICIVGSGAGAGPIAYELSHAGYQVVILEKGPWIKTEAFSKDEMSNSRKDVYASKTKEEPMMIHDRNKEKSIPYSNRDGGLSLWNGNCVGGSSNFMSGYFHRSKPQDFKLLSTYGSIKGANVVDWPISYADLEPYYAKVEQLVGVSGEVKKHMHIEPRSTSDYPYPPLKTNKIAQLLDNAAKQSNMELIPLARAILSQANEERNPCYYSNFCGSYACSSDAKGSSRAALLNQAIKTGNCTIIPFAKVYHLETDGNGKVVKAHYHHIEGDSTVEAQIFVVAAQAIESSRLLLMSKNKEFPNGLANNTGQVGKNLLFSGGGVGSGIFKKEDFEPAVFLELQQPGLFVNRALQQWYEISDFTMGPKLKGGTVDFLWEHANPIRRAIRQKWDSNGHLLYGSELKKKVHGYFTSMRKLNFEVFVDWLPTDKCFVELSSKEKDKYGDPVAKVNVYSHPHDQKVGRYLAAQARRLLEHTGAQDIRSSINGSPPSNLQAGGCRFGDDPASSVLDVNCKAHEVKNLYVSDGSFMPTGGSVTYTWTIYANSFRVADKIKNHLNQL
jgi:choline dehydrogenase-like flavoprotein